MSQLTARLLDSPSSPGRVRRWRPRFAEIAARLKAAYGVPSLGNWRDPVAEIFYIALSARTTDAQYRRTYRSLRQTFPRLEDLANAPAARVAECIAAGGLVNKRAAQLGAIARRLLGDLGPRPGYRLRKMTADGAFSFLTGLPGVGPKSALCVMMYSLDFDVFPVDVHVARVAGRIGAVPRGLKHYRAQALLPPLIPDGASKDVHVGMVVLGRSVCRVREPRCPSCPIGDLCRTGRRRLRSKARGTDGEEV